jgi:hypothetical protein
MEDVGIHFMDMWSILRPCDIFYGHFVVIWYIFPILVYCIKKNLATLISRRTETRFSCKSEKTAK